MALLILWFLAANAVANRSQPVASEAVLARDLKCELRANPPGIDAANPRLSWIVASPRRGDRQSFFQVLVSNSLRKLDQGDGNLWNSGKVFSNRSGIGYAGKSLQTGTRCFWKVRVGSTSGAISHWSQSGTWTMGQLQRSDWRAEWIAAPELAEPRNWPRTPIHCYRSQLTRNPNSPKSITLDLGNAQPIDRVILAPARPNGLTWDIRSVQFPRRFRIVASETANFRVKRVLVDQTASDYPDPRSNSCEFKFAMSSARYVRLEVSRLGTWDAGEFGIFLAQISVFSGSRNVSVGALVSATDSIESQDWSKSFLVDGHPRVEFGPFPPALDPKVPAAFSPSRVSMLRREFNLDAPVRRATLSSTARGFYEARINGRKVSEDLLAPGFTDYYRRQSYETYDVTNQLHRGKNTLAALLGYGWFAGHMNLSDNGYLYGYFPRFAAQLDVELTNGRKITIGTDRHWQASIEGSIRWSDILDGEACDLRKEPIGWDQAGFRSSAWSEAWSQPIGPDEFGDAKFVAQRNAPVRAIREMAPVRQRQIRPGVWTFDLGQEITGWVRLRTPGPRGTHIVVRHTEAVRADGQLDADSLMGTRQRDDYFLDGKGTRTLQPHFTYHGFRYFEVSGLASPPKPGDIVAINLHTGVDEVGKFECSNQNFNRMMTASKWTEQNMLFDVPTGCAARSERLAWNGDIRPCVQTALFNFDTAAFFEKYAADIRDDQKPGGRFTDISPHAHLAGTEICVGSPGWADAGVSLPWETYVNSGSLRSLAETYEASRAWVDYVHRNNPDLIWRNARGMDWGDWLSAGRETPKELGSTAFFAHSVDLLAKSARALGRQEDAVTYGALFAKIKAAFAARFVLSDGIIQMPTPVGTADVRSFVGRLMTNDLLDFKVNNATLGGDPAPDVSKSLCLKYRAEGQILEREFPEGGHVDLQTQEILGARYHAVQRKEDDVQGSYALALHFGLLDEPIRYKAIQRLIKVIARDGGHPTTGFWSSVELVLALSESGQQDVASQLANLTTYPSWGSMLQGNGTTFWEAFDADKRGLSFNHWTHSACGEWLWRDVAGLNPDPEQPGYRGFTVRPRPTALVSWCKASYRSVRGPVKINWRRSNRLFTLDLQVPVGSVAEVYVPGDVASIRESNLPINQARGVRFLKIVNQVPVYEVQSGSYHFTSMVGRD